MKIKVRMAGLLLFALMNVISAEAQSAATHRIRSEKQTPGLSSASSSTPVAGIGTPGQLTVWTGFNSNNSFIGDSIITETKLGLIGIGTTAPTSKLTVQGMIETTLGGLKFPDGSLQSTAGLISVAHDSTLMGDGSGAIPLAIAFGGVGTMQLANGAVTSAKIAPLAVVRSINGLFDNVNLVAGSNITLTPSGSSLTIAAPDSLTGVTHNATLSGDGTGASPLRVANGGIGTAQLADQSVTSFKLAPNAAVTNINGLSGGVTLNAGENITVTPSGNVLTIAAASPSSAVAYFSNQDLSFGFLNSPGQDIVSKTVPAGSYAIFARVEVFNEDSDHQDLDCTLSTGVVGKIQVPAIQDASLVLMTLQDVATFTDQTTITMHCSGFNIVSLQHHVSLTAIRVASIQ
jgi:hypothetical protein